MDTDQFTKMMLLNISQRKEADAAVKQPQEQDDPGPQIEDTEIASNIANKPTPPLSRRNKRLSNTSASQAENQVITEAQHQVPPSPPTSRRRNRMVSPEEEEEDEKVVQSPPLRPQNHMDPIIPAELNNTSKKPAPPPHRHSKTVQPGEDGINISPPPPPRSRQVTEDNGGNGDGGGGVAAKLNRSKSLKIEGPPPPPPRGLRKAVTVQERSPPQMSTESSPEAGGGGETDLSGALDDLQKEVDELLRQAQTRLNV